MPYVAEERKQALLAGATPLDAGELNFVLTMVVLDYLDKHPISYQALNDVSGALTECRVEFERRVVRPYEDVKLTLNGDVYAHFITTRLAPTLQAAVDERSG